MNLQLRFNHGMLRSTCNEIAGNDFECGSGPSCVVSSQLQANKICQRYSNCIGFVTNVEGTKHTLKTRKTHSKNKCQAVVDLVLNTSKCTPSYVRRWLKYKCSPVDSCIAPRSILEDKPFSTALKPLLITVQTNGAPFFMNPNNVVPWKQNYINLAQSYSFTNTRSKVDMLYRFLQSNHTIEENRLVIFADGNDVEFGGCSNIAENLQSISKSGVIFSAEFGCGEVHTPFPPGCIAIPQPSQGIYWPINTQANCEITSHNPVPCAQGPFKYKYLNSGLFAGSKHAVLKMLRTIKRYPQPCFWNRAKEVYSDQAMYIRYFLDHPTRVHLDYEGAHFLTTFRLKPKSTMRTMLGVVLKWYSSPICFLHHAGKSMYKYY